MLKNVNTINEIKGPLYFVRKGSSEAWAINIISSVLLLNSGLIDTDQGRRGVLHHHLAG
jgi:hypothetical protein